MRVLGGNCFMPEIQTKAVVATSAHNSGQNQCRVKKWQIVEFRRVTEIPEHTGSWAALHITTAQCMHGKSWSSTGNNFRDRQTLSEQLVAQGEHLIERHLGPGRSRRRVGIINMTVISMQPGGLQSRTGCDAAIQAHGSAVR